MHELGITFYIIRDVKEVAEANNVKKVNSVTVELGEVSGVVPEYLIDCWNWAVKKEDVLNGASLICEVDRAYNYCEDCQNEYETMLYGKICPKCHSEHTYLLKGKDCCVKQIEVYDE